MAGDPLAGQRLQGLCAVPAGGQRRAALATINTTAQGSRQAMPARDQKQVCPEGHKEEWDHSWRVPRGRQGWLRGWGSPARKLGEGSPHMAFPEGLALSAPNIWGPLG